MMIAIVLIATLKVHVFNESINKTIGIASLASFITTLLIIWILNKLRFSRTYGSFDRLFSDPYSTYILMIIVILTTYLEFMVKYL